MILIATLWIDITIDIEMMLKLFGVLAVQWMGLKFPNIS